MRYSVFGLAVTASLLSPFGASALTAKQTVQKEVVISQPDGSEFVERVAAERVTPGERIVYTLNFTNDLEKPATDIVLTMPVPSEVIYMEGSASNSGLPPQYSVDGGKTFAPRADLRVRSELGQMRKASAGDITNIRWTVPGPINSGASGSLSYKAVLK